MQNIIKDTINKINEDLGLPAVKFVVEHPKDESHGDWSSNVAMAIWGKEKGSKELSEKSIKSPRELAEKIVEQLMANSKQLVEVVEKVEVAGAGFINFTLKPEYLVEQAGKAMEDGYGENESLAGKKIMVEYTDPNPFKEFHIGHLMSNTIGESIARLVAVQGAEVVRANYQGDVGLHVAKSVWGMRKKMESEKESLVSLQGQALKVRQAFMGQAYALGASEYEGSEETKAEMNALNKTIYEGSDSEVMELYQQGREWSLEYFETIYSRLGTKFDEYFFESEAGPVGLAVVEEGLAKGVLELGEGGAVVYKGEQDGLHTRVFRNALGLATYEGKELGLAKTKYERYKYDRSLIVTANEITEYFRVLLTVMSKLYPDLAKKTTHLPHGMMKLTTGKMSSRTGKVVTGEGLLNELREVVLAKMGEREVENKEEVADQIAVGALKWTVLKQQVGGDIVYEPSKMTNLEGDTGPYVQYTFARSQSVLRKSQVLNPKSQTNSKSQIQITKLGEEELGIVRWIARYPEVVAEAGGKYAPHLVASYIYELATRFNSFYNGGKIVGDPTKEWVTRLVAQVIESGLGLLGIDAPREM